MERNPQFDALFEEHYHAVYCTIYKVVGNKEEAEDLAQEAFIRLYRHFEKVDLPRVHQWLHRVSINLGLNAIRGRKRWRQWQQKATLESQVHVESKPPKVLSNTLVRKTLASLSERQAQMLMLYAAGFSYEELADAVDVKKSSVSQLLMRARRAFEETYKELEGDTT